jgi:hypothetical protein
MKGINKRTLTLLQASVDVGQEVNTEKIKYMFMSHHQNKEKIAIYWLMINPLNTQQVKVK